MFHFPDQGEGLVGDEVRQVVRLVPVSVVLQLSVNVEGVVVVATVAHQARPPAPPRGHVVAGVAVEVLSVVRSHVAGVLNRSYSLETRGKELVTPSYKQQSAIYGDNRPYTIIPHTAIPAGGVRRCAARECVSRSGSCSCGCW